MSDIFYRFAFDQYLRKGTCIEDTLEQLYRALALSTKSESAVRLSTNADSGLYIWRTRGDDKVRGSHAKHDGQIFLWKNPPREGHPGEDFNCRCWAEPIDGRDHIRQLLISSVQDNSDQWKWYDFVFHYYFGNGKGVTLEEVGLLGDVIRLAHTHEIDQVGHNLEQQLKGAIKETKDNFLSGGTRNGYNFISVNYVLRISEVKTNYKISIEKIDNHLVFNGTVDFIFTDAFADPLDIMQGITSIPQDLFSFLQKIAAAKNWSKEKLKEIYSDIETISPKELPKWIRTISEPGSKPYSIESSWRTKIMGTLKL